MGAKKYNVAYITDAGYLLPTKASIKSLVDSIGDKEVDVHVIHTGVEARRLSELSALQTPRMRVRLLEGGEHFADLWGPSHRYLTKAALYKFLLPQLLPELDSVLYIDGDTLVYPGFLGIFDESLEGVYAAVVADMGSMQLFHRHEKVGVSRYFNSGVMLLDLAKMRADGVYEKLVDYIRPGGDRLFVGDQDAFNVVFGQNVRYTSLRFNCFSVAAYARDFAEEEVLAFFKAGRDDLHHPAIRHFAGSKDKPWKSVRAPDAVEWLRHAAAEDALEVARNYVKAAIDERDACIALKTGSLSQYPLGENMILPVTGGIELDGFHPPEQNGRWIGGKARIRIRNRDLKGNTTGLVLRMKAVAMGVDRGVRVLFCGTEVWNGIVPCKRREVIEIRLAPSEAREETFLEIEPEGESPTPLELGISNDPRPLALFFEYIELTVATSRRLDDMENKLKAQGSAVASQGAAIAAQAATIADYGATIADHGAMIAQIRQSLDTAHEGLRAACAALQATRLEIVAIRNSTSFRIARALTFVPRKFRAIFATLFGAR